MADEPVLYSPIGASSGAGERFEPNTAAKGAAAPPDPLRLLAITVKRGRMVCKVAIDDPRFRRTTPALAEFVRNAYPDLPHHACVNGRGPMFESVMGSTSAAHMLEHLAISFQTRAAVDESAAFVGTTEWIDEEEGVARVEISFRDDLEAIRAFVEATRFLNMAMLTCIA